MSTSNKRPFNKDAYIKMDGPSKTALFDMMTAKGYKLVGDINTEEYKKYDLKFIKNNKTITFELEMRKVFDRIKSTFNTIHIPIRKANNQSDWYIVFKIGCEEFAMIETKVIRQYAKTNIAEVDCNPGTDHNYVEDFIDVPKNRWKFYKKINNKWKDN